jgi:hypothetical protein
MYLLRWVVACPALAASSRSCSVAPRAECNRLGPLRGGTEKSREIAIGFDLDPGLLLSKVTEELSGETARVREREEMVTWKLVDAGV